MKSSQQHADELLAEYQARFRLTVTRSEMLKNYYDAERRAGATPLEANERLHFFAKRLDGPCPLEREQEAVRKIMESAT